MKLPHVLLRSADGAHTWTLLPGGIIGRMAAAACRLADPRVSEAHALLSVRGRGLFLLSLRGALDVDGVEESEVELQVGQHLRLASCVELTVEEVVLPDQVLALAVGEYPPQELCAPAYSITAGSRAELVPEFQDAAVAWVWSTAEGWVLQDDERHRHSVRPGRSWMLRGVPVEALLVPVEALSRSTTLGGTEEGLVVVARHSSTLVQRRGRGAAMITGQPGRVLSELAAMGVPAPWTAVAHELWPHLDSRRDRDALRTNWDRVLRRLRKALREHGIRDDLVHSDGLGNVELLLHLGDRVVDES